MARFVVLLFQQARTICDHAAVHCSVMFVELAKRAICALSQDTRSASELALGITGGKLVPMMGHYIGPAPADAPGLGWQEGRQAAIDVRGGADCD